jgi:organic radical activating enzyme
VNRSWLLVSETFETLQGEGPRTGVPSLFIRLGGCNLHCEWCDTPYTWAFDQRHADMHNSTAVPYDPTKELHRIPLYTVVGRIFASGSMGNIRNIVFTGGEPLLQLTPMAAVISAANEYPKQNYTFEIETAGTIRPGELLNFENVYFNVSPKLGHSGNEIELRRNISALRDLQVGRTVFKFVVTLHEDPQDQRNEIAEICEEADIPAHQVWLMPCGTTESEINEGLRYWAPWAIKNGWNLTGRQQITIWGDTRGT